MEANKNRIYTNLALGVSLTLFTCFATYQFSNVVFQGKSYVASVNGKYITAIELKDRMNAEKGKYIAQMGTDFKTEQGQKTFTELRKNVLKEMVLIKAILGHAEQENVIVTEETVKQEIDKIKLSTFHNDDSEFKKALKKSGISADDLPKIMREQMILKKYVTKLLDDNVKVTDTDVKNEYVKNKSQYTTPESVQVSDISVATEDEAKKIYAQLESGKDFSTLARQFSTDAQTKAKGGDMGFFAKGVKEPALEKAAFALQIGETSQPIKLNAGYYIIKKNGYRPEALMDFDKVKDGIKKRMASEKQKVYFDTWRDKLMKDAEVKYNKGYESYSFAPPAPEKKEISKTDTKTTDTTKSSEPVKTDAKVTSPADATKTSEPAKMDKKEPVAADTTKSTKTETNPKEAPKLDTKPGNAAPTTEGKK
ncbi:MAG: peptidylprolyl isomerase [Candidatus Sericytochromatia bacterium]|nr:peptidylprolyl isomerase [Candidatus Sericytochromatia bacterium]